MYCGWNIGTDGNSVFTLVHINISFDFFKRFNFFISISSFDIIFTWLFYRLGLDNYLEKLRHHESEELQVQISAYLDNVFDVGALMEDSEVKTQAVEKMVELQEELAHYQERLSESEASWLAKSVELETEIEDLRKANHELLSQNTQVMDEVSQQIIGYCMQLTLFLQKTFQNFIKNIS